ncbi:hypothetical protein [Nocardia sp. NBC_01009]|uniref:hypothetical protein n=1 Tax=Nocardia sp. NBC_01009 TaxID=2975996 RepID=UPI00386DD213|nr:hypothetical protein OHA42_17510 [Nocardia sp. NBC_01009]
MNLSETHSSVDSPEVRRALSPTERWYWILDQVSPLNIVAWVSIRGHIAHDVLEQAAQVLYRRHPLLRVRVDARPDGTDPAFVAARSANLHVRHVDSGSDVAVWKDEIEGAELSTALDSSSGCLARITDVVQNVGTLAEAHVLILTLSHVIGDAESATGLVSELVDIACKLSDDRADVANRELSLATKSGRVLLAPDQSLPRSHRGVSGLGRVFLSMLEQLRHSAQRPMRLMAPEGVSLEDGATRIVGRIVFGVDFQNLLAACDAHSVELRSAITVALAWAVSDLKDGRGSERICIGVGDDTRKAVAANGDEVVLGAYTTLTPAMVRRGKKEDFWSRVREVDHYSRDRIDRCDHVTPLLLMKFISPPSVNGSANAVKMAERRGPGNVVHISVTTRRNPDDHGRWEVSPPEFAVSLSATGYLGACTTVADSSLQWNTVFACGAVSAVDAESVADSALLLLLSVL